MRARFCTRRRLIGVVTACFLVLNVRLVLNWWYTAPDASTHLSFPQSPSSGQSPAQGAPPQSPPSSAVALLPPESGLKPEPTSVEEAVDSSPTKSLSTADAAPSKSSPPSNSSPAGSIASASSASSSKNAYSDPCLAYPKNADIVIVVKTGATEASKKLPWQFMSFLSCAKDDVLIFSDMAQQIGDHEVYDSLDTLTEETRANNTDLGLYEDQHRYLLEGSDIGWLDNRARDSWGMDKYKNIHTAQKAWKLRPNKSWYLFIDADTYIVWSSLFAYLNHLDKTEKIYFGAEVPSEDREAFAHGGSGYGLSRGAMETLVGDDAEEVAAAFEAGVRTICCGDIELGQSLFNKNIKITNAHPMINGEKPRRYWFGPVLWCQPLITMHHIAAEEMNDIWQFERRRPNPEEPLLFEEIFTEFIEPHLPARRSDWDDLSEEAKLHIMPAEYDYWENLSENFIYEPPKQNPAAKRSLWGPKEDPHLEAYQSIEKCIKACKEKPDCFQYQYTDQKCQLAKYIRFGNRKDPEEGQSWKSGWDLDRIEKFKKDNSPCKKVDFRAYHQYTKFD